MELACALQLSHGSLDVAKAAKLVGDAGFDALKVSPWIPRNLTRIGIKRLKASLKSNNLAFAGFLAIYPPELILASPSLPLRKRSISYTMQLIELADNLDGRVLVWGSGRSRDILRTVPYERGYGWLVELLKASCSLADERNIKIAIEPLNRYESTIIHNMKEALSLAKSVNRKSVGVVYDTFHVNLEENSFIDPILAAGKRLVEVHISDCNRRIPGRGHIDFMPIFSTLKKVGYNGYVTLEAVLPSDPTQDLVAARKYLQKMID